MPETYDRILLLAGWFPQITVDDTNVFTTRFIYLRKLTYLALGLI